MESIPANISNRAEWIEIIGGSNGGIVLMRLGRHRRMEDLNLIRVLPKMLKRAA